MSGQGSADRPDDPGSLPFWERFSVHRITPDTHVSVTRGTETDDRFYAEICADKYNNHVFICMRSFAEPELRFFAHYGLGAQNVCADAYEWHEGSDKVVFCTDIQRMPGIETFEDLCNYTTACQHEFIAMHPHLPHTNIWTETPFSERVYAKYKILGYDVRRNDCRTFALWMATVKLGADFDTCVATFHRAGFAWGVTGSMRFIDSLHEMDAAIGQLRSFLPGGAVKGITLYRVE